MSSTSNVRPGQAPAHEFGLRRQLTAGQMTMVAVGGSIGTGLLLGTASAIQLAGPAVVLTFALAAFVSWTVTLALGELASLHPAAGSFGVYGEIYLGPYAGFVSAAGYWLSIAVSVGAEMIAAGTYMQLWFPRVPTIAWVFVFSGLLLAINLLAVQSYGRVEFWFAMIKVAVVASFIILGAALLLTGRAVPQYTAHGGFFPLGAAAPLLAITFALYSFGGVEIVAVTSGESAATRDIGSATRRTFLTLAILYIGAVAVLVGVMPWNRAGTGESPFVTVFRGVNLPGATHFMNFVVLTAALSGANAVLYVSSRTLFALARRGWAPSALGRLNAKGAPTLAVLASSFGIVVALALERWAPARAFEYILRGALFGMMLSWMVSLAAHIIFRRKVAPAQLAEIPARSPLGQWGSVVGLAAVLLAVAKTWFDSRVNLLAGVTFLMGLTLAYLLIKPGRQPPN